MIAVAKLSEGSFGTVLVKTPLHPATVTMLRDQIDPRRRWDAVEKAWSYPAEPAVLSRILEVFQLDRLAVPEGLRKLLPPPLPVPKREVDLSVIDGYEFLTEPYQHQREGLAMLVREKRWLLSWEPGCGKSKTICDRIRMAFQILHDIAGPILILCPKGVLFVWGDELKTHANLTVRTWPDYGPEWIVDGAIMVANYDALVSETNLKRFLKVNWQMVVYDEVQKCKNITTKRFKAAKKVSAKSTHRYAISGTPAPNGPLDFLGAMTLLDPSILGTESKTAFTARYAITQPVGTGMGRQVVGYQNLADLNQRVASVSDRRTKDECLDLPPKIYQTRHCQLEGEQARIYAELRKHAVARLTKAKDDNLLTAKNILTEQLRLLQIVGGFVPDEEGKIHALKTNIKLELLDEVLEELGSQPVVIWCAFLEELRAVVELLSNQGRSVTSFSGENNDKERRDSVHWFQSGHVDTFVATASAGGTGITLTRASVEVFYSRTYNLEHWLQAQDRLHRVGQTKSVQVISLVARGTVDEKIERALAEKESLQELVMRKAPEELL